MDGPVLHKLDLRLSYGECDPSGIVYYGAYYPWMERVYNEWTFLQGHPNTVMLERWGANHVSRASSCEYIVPGKLFDPLTCSMRFEKMGTTSFSMVFDFVRTTDRVLVARGHIAFVFIDAEGQSTPVPTEMKESLRSAGVEV